MAFNSIFIKFIETEDGASLIEYGLLLVLIMVVCAIAVALLGTTTSTLFTFSW